LASSAITVLEYIYRAGLLDNLFSLTGLLVMVPLALITQYALWSMYPAAPSFLLGWGVFTGVNAVMRIGTNHFLGEPFGTKTFFGISLLVLALFMIRSG